MDPNDETEAGPSGPRGDSGSLFGGSIPAPGQPIGQPGGSPVGQPVLLPFDNIAAQLGQVLPVRSEAPEADRSATK